MLPCVAFYREVTCEVYMLWFWMNFHDVTIVDMGELPEVSVSIADLSRFCEQWPPTVLRHMVWLQQDLDVMRAEARKRFRNARPGRCSYCDKMIKCDIYRYVSTYHLDLA